jgi:hypothetical protein
MKTPKVTQTIQRHARDRAMQAVTERRVLAWFNACKSELMTLGMEEEAATKTSMALFDANCGTKAYLDWPNADITAQKHAAPPAPSTT